MTAERASHFLSLFWHAFGGLRLLICYIQLKTFLYALWELWFLCQNNVLLLCSLWSAFANLLVKCSDYNFVLTVRLTTRDVSVEFACD